MLWCMILNEVQYFLFCSNDKDIPKEALLKLMDERAEERGWTPEVREKWKGQIRSDDYVIKTVPIYNIDQIMGRPTTDLGHLVLEAAKKHIAEAEKLEKEGQKEAGKQMRAVAAVLGSIFMGEMPGLFNPKAIK